MRRSRSIRRCSAVQSAPAAALNSFSTSNQKRATTLQAADSRSKRRAVNMFIDGGR
jgi:hypothetical protein